MNRWSYKVKVGDLFHNDDLTIEQKAQAIAERLRKGRWMDADCFGELDGLLDELSDVTGAATFDAVWDAIYDWADIHRLWIDTFCAVSA